MSNIPKAREALLSLATTLSTREASAIRSIVQSYLWREPAVRRAPEKSRDITPAMRAQIHALGKTDMHISEIGHRLGINPGRVSEVLNGKR